VSFACSSQPHLPLPLDVGISLMDHNLVCHTVDIMYSVFLHTNSKAKRHTLDGQFGVSAGQLVLCRGAGLEYMCYACFQY
jgi:hypothetical protein